MLGTYISYLSLLNISGHLKQFQLNHLLSQLTKLANIFWETPSPPPRFFLFLQACNMLIELIKRLIVLIKRLIKLINGLIGLFNRLIELFDMLGEFITAIFINGLIKLIGRLAIGLNKLILTLTFLWLCYFISWVFFV